MKFALRTLAFEDLAVGMSETMLREVGHGDIMAFAEISGDHNPIHVNDDFAAQSQFGKRIAHGMFSASLISTVIGTRLPGAGSIYLGQSLKFMGPVFLGDHVEVSVSVTELMPEKNRVRLACICKVKGAPVLEGEALVKVPGRDELQAVA